MRDALGHLQAFGLGPIGEPWRRQLDDKDWLESWKASFRPSGSGGSSSGRRGPRRDADDAIVVVLDPGMAFGTGLHPTTQQCLEALSTIGLDGRCAPRRRNGLGHPRDRRGEARRQRRSSPSTPTRSRSTPRARTRAQRGRHPRCRGLAPWMSPAVRRRDREHRLAGPASSIAPHLAARALGRRDAHRRRDHRAGGGGDAPGVRAGALEVIDRDAQRRRLGRARAAALMHRFFVAPRALRSDRVTLTGRAGASDRDGAPAAGGATRSCSSPTVTEAWSLARVRAADVGHRRSSRDAPRPPSRASARRWRSRSCAATTRGGRRGRDAARRVAHRPVHQRPFGRAELSATRNERAGSASRARRPRRRGADACRRSTPARAGTSCSPRLDRRRSFVAWESERPDAARRHPRRRRVAVPRDRAGGRAHAPTRSRSRASAARRSSRSAGAPCAAETAAIAAVARAIAALEGSQT